MNSPSFDSPADVESFIARWSGGDGGQERANYALFLSELCDVLGTPRPDQASHNAATNAYVFERAVTFREPDGSTAAGRIDLYKRAEAYGWPADLSDEDILVRLVALNAERAAEERRGLIRWLRPDYQRARAGIAGETPKPIDNRFWPHRTAPIRGDDIIIGRSIAPRGEQRTLQIGVHHCRPAISQARMPLSQT